MCKLNKKNYGRRIDPCMKYFINWFKDTEPDLTFNVIACCCGHYKYSMTIICKDKYNGEIFDLVSGKSIPRKKKFYKYDKQGYPYIPELVLSQTSLF